MTKRKGQQDKQRSTKHYTENKRSSNTYPTKNWGQYLVLMNQISQCVDQYIFLYIKKMYYIIEVNVILPMLVL
jgi:hypothetical protein